MKHKNFYSAILFFSLTLNPFSHLSQWLSGWKLARCLSLTILLLIVFCQLPIVAFAQNTFRYKLCPDVGPLPRWNIFVDAALHQVPSDSGYMTLSTAARDLIVTPATPNDSLPWNCFSAARLDKYGNLKWIKAYQEISGINHKTASDGVLTADSGFVMAGYKTNLGNPYYNGKNTFIQKIDKDGKALWSKVYKINSNENHASKIRPMPDGGCVVMGQAQDAAISSISYTYLLRLDKNGVKTWCYMYDANQDGSGGFSSLDLTADGGFILGGSSNASGFNQDATYGNKALMMKLNADGTIVWTKRYGEVFKGTLPYTNEELTNDAFYDVKQTPDGEYIAVGQTHRIYNSKGWVVKITAEGTIDWQKTYSNGTSTVEVLSDGYLLSSAGQMTKISETGEVVWSKIYDQNISDISLTMDKGFVMAVSEGGGAVGTSPEKSIVKTNHLGEFDSGCYYENALTSRVDERADSSYAVTSKAPGFFTTLDLPLREITITGRNLCPVICGTGNKAIAPTYIYAPTACINTEAGVALRPEGSGYSIFSHYKVDFGDPASGADNTTIGSNVSESNLAVSHTYSDPGTYTVTMVVYNGDYSESDTVSTQIAVMPELKITLLTPEIHVCKQDTMNIAALVMVGNNDAPYTYWGWTQENGNTPGIIAQQKTGNGSLLTLEATVIADTSQDYYTVMAYSIYTGPGCAARDTVRVIPGDNEALIAGDTKICKGATASLKASGGDSYLWSTGAVSETITVSPASNTTYWVEATSADGCRDTAYVYVQVVSAINVEAFADREAVCIGDTVHLYASGAQSYTWSNGAAGDSVQIVPANGINTYVVTGTSGSCTDTATIQIPADPVPNGSISGPGAVCYDGTYTLTASGGDSYKWLNYSADQSNPVQTFYMQSISYKNSVTITKGGCSTSKEYAAFAGPPFYPPSVEGIYADECRVCPGTEVTLRKYFWPVPGYHTDTYPDDDARNQGLTYQWSTGQTGSADSVKITVTRDTIVTLIATNGAGCSVTKSIRVEATPHVSIQKEVWPIPSCDRSPTTIYLTGEPLLDTEYDWGNGIKNDTLVVSPLQDSMLYITVTANGCTRKDSIWVYAKSNLPKATITGDAVVCKGTPTTYSVTGNAPITGYRWLSDDSANPTITLTTNNDVTLKAVLTFTLGCTDTASYNIKVKEATIPTVSGNTQICPNGTVELTANGGYTYQWNTGSTSRKISITTPKDSTVKVIISNNGCQNDTLSVTITTSKTITATLFSDADTICAGTALTLIAGGGETYTWSTGEKEETIGILPALSTTYTVSVTTDDNCLDVESITITVKPSPTLSVSGQTTLCFGRSATLQATTNNGIGYLWNTGESTANISVNPTKDSTYSVSTFIGDCSVSQNLAISVIPSTSISAGIDQAVLSGTEITLVPSGGTDYNWSTVDGVICSNCNTIYDSPTQTTTYYLSETGVICSEDSVTIYVLNCSNLFVPNAFSPNSDGVNDVLYVKNDCIKDLIFEIYDRWGNKVFESNNTSIGWDGTYDGKKLDPTVFVYYVNATVGGISTNQHGNITLVK